MYQFSIFTFCSFFSIFVLYLLGNSDFKIGQKYPTPAPANGDRVFYESLLIQVPTR